MYKDNIDRNHLSLVSVSVSGIKVFAGILIERTKVPQISKVIDKKKGYYKSNNSQSMKIEADGV